MNFYPDMGMNNMNGMHPGIGYMNGEFNGGNNLFNRLNEIDNRLKRLEQRIILLENEKKNNSLNYSEPDNSLYMI